MSFNIKITGGTFIGCPIGTTNSGLNFTVGSGGTGAMSYTSEKTQWGAERVSSIRVSADARLIDTTVDGLVRTGANLCAIGAKIQQIKVGASSIITKSFVGSGESGSEMTIIDSESSGEIKAGAKLLAERCSRLGALSSIGIVSVRECPIVGSVKGNNVSLINSAVLGDVESTFEPTIINSEIRGTLNLSGRNFTIENSQIHTIRILAQLPSSAPRRMQGKFMIESPIADVMMFRPSRPGMFIIDGVDQYYAQKSEAAAAAPTTTELPTISLLLKGCKVDNIIFEGGKGEVTLEGNSEIAGSIINGEAK